MRDFLIIEESDEAGIGFSLFDRSHIIWLALSALLIVLLCFAYLKTADEKRTKFRRVVGSVIFSCEVIKDTQLIAAGVFSVYYLPLHLCGIAVFLSFYHSFCGGETLGNFLYSTCMPGAAFALLFPDWTASPPFCLKSMVSFIVHALITAYPIMCVLGKDIRPDHKKLPKCFLILLGLAVPVYVFDRIFRANFMFLLRPSADSPLEWFAGFLGVPGYILGYIPMLLLVWAVLYLPFFQKERI